MATQITRAPLGLQNYLGSQAFGQNPNVLNADVQPVLDLKDFYDIDNDRWYIEATPSFTTQEAVIATHEVPGPEIWLVRSIHLQMAYLGNTQTDAQYLHMALTTVGQSNSPGSSHPLTDRFEVDGRPTANTFEQPGPPTIFPTPLIVLGGSTFQLINTRGTGEGIFSATFAINYTRIQK